MKNLSVTKITCFLVSFLYLVLFIAPIVISQDIRDLNGQNLSFGEQSKKKTRSFSTYSQETNKTTEETVQIGSIPVSGPGENQPLYYNIHVLGEVKRPGVVKIRPSDRLGDAVRYAGDLLPSGSQRAIQLRRTELVKQYDLYLYKQHGRLDQNPYLMDNDVVFVPLKKGEIQVEGPVQRPGYYEIIHPISAQATIELAGGYTVGHILDKPIQVIRYDSKGDKKIIGLGNSKEELKKFQVKPGDIVIIPHMLIKDYNFDYNIGRLPGDNLFYPTANDNVYVVGAVLHPGPYPFQPTLKYKDYISYAGLTNLASISRAKVIRSDGKRLYARKVDRINAGDTIMVPSKSVTLSNGLDIFNTVTNTFLTTITIRQVIKGL